MGEGLKRAIAAAKATRKKTKTALQKKTETETVMIVSTGLISSGTPTISISSPPPKDGKLIKMNKI